MRKLFMTAVLGATMWTVGPIQAQETLDTASVPASFRPYVHLLGSAEVIAPASGPNWRAMDIKAYNEDRKKYQELEAMVLKVWPQVQIMTVMLDTLRPTFLAGIDAVPLDTLRAQRKSIQTERDAAKAERRAERKNKNDDTAADEAPESSESVEVALGEETTGPDTLRLSGDDCMVALMVQQGYLDLDSLDADGQRLMVQDTAFDGDLGIKEGFLLVHLLDRQNPGMLDFADDYAKAVKLPFWRTIKTFSRLTGYRINKSYDPERYDGRLEHIIRKHGLDRLDLPCSGR
ncbi:MAG: hypothetical protein L7S63_01900 [Flavobacteriales bacterium]|nr:hypothetical protein [Flavobacteriales bacterium]